MAPGLFQEAPSVTQTRQFLRDFGVPTQDFTAPVYHQWPQDEWENYPVVSWWYNYLKEVGHV
jgi:hypothetical protein